MRVAVIAVKPVGRPFSAPRFSFGSARLVLKGCLKELRL